MKPIQLSIKISSTVYSILLLEHYVVIIYYKSKEHVTTEKICHTVLRSIRVRCKVVLYMHLDKGR